MNQLNNGSRDQLNNGSRAAEISRGNDQRHRYSLDNLDDYPEGLNIYFY